MIIGIGIDIVRVDRFVKWTENPALAERFFHPQALKVCAERAASGRQFSAQSLAVRFAAKEAFGKALGTGLRGIALREICVTHLLGGRPCMKLEGKALSAFRASGAAAIHVTLSHERDSAVACVLLEK